MLGQLVHSPAPDESLYLPEAHAKHGPPLLPEYPALQVQALMEELPNCELELAAQLLHAPSPGEYLYFPSPQAEHVPPLLPVNPALQVQEEEEVLPDGEWELEGQFVHCPLSAYFPAAHVTVEGTTLHVPRNPLGFGVFPAPPEVKTTCRNGWLVDDVYELALMVLPDSFASSCLSHFTPSTYSTASLHNHDAHRLTYTKSLFNSVAKDEKEKLIWEFRAGSISHLQLA